MGTPLPPADGLVIGHFTVSLDGYVAGPAASMEFLRGLSFDPAILDRSVATVGAVLAGRTSLDITAERGLVKPYGGAWSGPIFILTHHPDDAPDLPGFIVLGGTLAEAVATAREAAGGKNVEVHSPTLVRQLLELGLLDDLYLHVAPVLVGGGVPLFDRPDGPPVTLEVVECYAAGGPRQPVDLHLRPAV